VRCERKKTRERRIRGQDTEENKCERKQMLVCCSVLQCVAVCCSVLQCVVRERRQNKEEISVKESRCGCERKKTNEREQEDKRKKRKEQKRKEKKRKERRERRKTDRRQRDNGKKIMGARERRQRDNGKKIMGA